MSSTLITYNNGFDVYSVFECFKRNTQIVNKNHTQVAEVLMFLEIARKKILIINDNIVNEPFGIRIPNLKYKLDQNLYESFSNDTFLLKLSEKGDLKSK